MELLFQQFADSALIVQLDNGAFHTAKHLAVLDNIVLLFQPPYCPELNPIARVWQYLKHLLRWKLPCNLAELREALKEQLVRLTKATIASITRRASLLEAPSAAGILCIGITCCWN